MRIGERKSPKKAHLLPISIYPRKFKPGHRAPSIGYYEAHLDALVS